MKKFLISFIILTTFAISPLLGQDIDNLSSALRLAAENAAPAYKVKPKSPYIAQMTKQNDLITVFIKIEKNKYIKYDKQMIFERGIFKGTQEIPSFVKNGFISITYNSTQFELYAVSSRITSYKMPFMLSEISSSQLKYNVSNIVATQYTYKNTYYTVFYFLIPKRISGFA